MNTNTWIDMTDQLPTEPGDYALRWSDNDLETFHFDEGDLIDIKNNNGMVIPPLMLRVTHWLKLPKVPNNV